MAAPSHSGYHAPSPTVGVEVGPVSGAAARAWLAEARVSLTTIRAQGGLGVPDVVLAGFDQLLAEWDDQAGGDEFHWTSEMEVATVRALASHWASVAAAVRHETSEVLQRPADEAQPFYDALVVAVTTALTDIDEMFAGTFADVVPAFHDSIAARVESPTRVLVVDDTEDIRVLVGIGLRWDARLEVAGEASDGVEALEKAQALHPDAILLDLMMPRMDGLTALPLLREIAPEARVVVFSANDERREAALAAGADAFIDKNAPHEAIAAALLGEP